MYYVTLFFFFNILNLAVLFEACFLVFVSCFITACDKETRISTRQSQSGRSLPAKKSASASTSTLSKVSGTDETTSGKHVFMYCLFKHT